jgi:hypothetical protein
MGREGGVVCLGKALAVMGGHTSVAAQEVPGCTCTLLQQDLKGCLIHFTRLDHGWMHGWMAE